MLIESAGWIALGTTCIAALMTASNLGARVTGWGFVIFTVGAVAWALDGFFSGQTQLLWSNGFLAAVDLFGIWRWLGRRAKFSDTSRAEELRSEDGRGDDLFSAASLDGMAVKGAGGVVIGHVVDALITCADGGIDYLVVREGGAAGLGETLRRLPWNNARVRDQAISTQLSDAEFSGLAPADPG
nr:PRC-barrel domain-containing protein [Sphingomonas chungangi]